MKVFPKFLYYRQIFFICFFSVRVYSQLLASAATGQTGGPPVASTGTGSASVGGMFSPSGMVQQYAHPSAAAAAAALYSPYSATGDYSARF